MGARYCRKWLSSTLQICTSANATRRKSSTQPYASARRGDKSSTEKCHRIRSLSAARTGDLFQVLSSRKERSVGGVQAYTRSTTAEQIHPQGEVQNAGITPNFSPPSPGRWLCSIDLQDAYFHIPVSPKHRKFLRFLMGSRHFQFRVLPFGLNSAPRSFFKMYGGGGGFSSQEGDIHLSLP